jgi:hypothetical protein
MRTDWGRGGDVLEKSLFPADFGRFRADFVHGCTRKGAEPSHVRMRKWIGWIGWIGWPVLLSPNPGVPVPGIPGLASFTAAQQSVTADARIARSTFPSATHTCTVYGTVSPAPNLSSHAPNPTINSALPSTSKYPRLCSLPCYAMLPPESRMRLTIP